MLLISRRVHNAFRRLLPHARNRSHQLAIRYLIEPMKPDPLAVAPARIVPARQQRFFCGVDEYRTGDSAVGALGGKRDRVRAGETAAIGTF
jgi:hypothetical protein